MRHPARIVAAIFLLLLSGIAAILLIRRAHTVAESGPSIILIYECTDPSADIAQVSKLAQARLAFHFPKSNVNVSIKEPQQLAVRFPCTGALQSAFRSLADARNELQASAFRDNSLDARTLMNALDSAADPNASQADLMATLTARYPTQAQAIRNFDSAWKAWNDAGGNAYPLPEDADDALIGGTLDFRIAVTDLDFGDIASKRFADALEHLQHDGPNHPFESSSEHVVWVKISPLFRERFSGPHFIISTDVQNPCILCFDDHGRTLLHADPRKRPWKVQAGAPYDDHITGTSLPFTLDEAGAACFGDLTRRNMRHPLAIIVSDRAYSVPIIQSELPGSAVISLGPPTSTRSSSALRNESSRLWRLLFAGNDHLPLRRIALKPAKT